MNHAPRTLRPISSQKKNGVSQRSRPELANTLVTTIWSAKEAALKAIRQGLRLDTRSVSLPRIEALGALPEAWTALQLLWERQADQRRLPPLSGWWKVDGPYVLTFSGTG